MQSRFLSSFLRLLAIASASFIVSIAQAQIPQTINYQGYLTNAASQPVNEAVKVTFRLYTAASGGAAVWTETQTGVGVINGIYNAVLGSVTAFNLPFNVPYFLSLQVKDDAEMAVRQPLSAVPYAQRAVTAEVLAAGATVPATQLTGTLASGQLPATQLLPTTACTINFIPQWNGTAWVCAANGAGTQGPAGPPGPAGVAGPPGPAGAILTLPQLQGMFVQSSSVRAPQATALAVADSGTNVGSYSSMTIGTDGLPVISYFDIAKAQLKVTKCGNGACSANNSATTVDSASGVGMYTSIAIGADGMPAIAYYDSTNGALKFARCADKDCAGGNAITTVDSTGTVGKFASLAIGADGLPVMSYYDVKNSTLKVAKCGNAACTAENTITTVDTLGDVGQFASIAIGADGLPVISYASLDSFNSTAIKVAKCGNAACSTGNVIRAPFQGRGTISALTVGADGLPILIVVEGFGGGTLTALKCGNADCSALNVFSSLDSAGSGVAKRDVSITTGADGLPLISYMSGDKLKVAKCGNVACSSGNTSNVVDTAGATGGYASINIGSDGLPVISYYDSTSSTLKVAKCANAYCIAAFRQR